MNNNNFDVIKNYRYEDEEIVFNSDDYNKCKVVCDEKQKAANKHDRYAVYASDSMLEGYNIEELYNEKV